MCLEVFKDVRRTSTHCYLTLPLRDSIYITRRNLSGRYLRLLICLSSLHLAMLSMLILRKYLLLEAQMVIFCTQNGGKLISLIEKSQTYKFKIHKLLIKLLSIKQKKRKQRAKKQSKRRRKRNKKKQLNRLIPHLSSKFLYKRPNSSRKKQKIFMI